MKHVVPARPRVPWRHFARRVPHFSLVLDERASGALDAIAAATDETPTIIMQTLAPSTSKDARTKILAAFRGLFGHDAPGRSLDDRGRAFTDRVKRAYQDAYSMAYRKEKAAALRQYERDGVAAEVAKKVSVARARKAGRETGREAAKKALRVQV